MKRNIKEDDDDLRKFLPDSFGKKETQFDSSAVLDKTRKKKVKPAEHVRVAGPKAPERRYEYGKENPPQLDPDSPIIEKEEVIEEFEEIDADNPFRIPYSHEAFLKGHEGIVTALGLDPNGVRLLSGGYDQSIKFWDFPAMDINCKYFRSIEPPDDVVHTLKYSKTGDRFLMAGNSPQARIYDRDGRELVEFVKGYPYITDMSSTKGHVSRITTAFWHPIKKELIITGSQDSSIRIWDVNDRKKHKQIIKLRNYQGAPKSPVMAAAMTTDGKILIAASQDGSLQMFPGDGPYTRPQARVNNAHESNSETSCVEFRNDNTMFLTRGCDDTLKVWELRKFTSPLAEFPNLPNKYPEADVAWSPDQKVFVAGTSVIPAKNGNEGEVGKLVFYNAATLTEIKSVSVSDASVVSLIWHPKINQIICGCSDQMIHVLYDPNISKDGIMYSVNKAPKKPRIEDMQEIRHIMNPHALPMFKQDPSARRKREKARMDPAKAHIPEAPQVGPGQGGRLGSSLTASIMKRLVKKDAIDDDPRAALLKYANAEPYWFKAYNETQPITIFDNTTTTTTATTTTNTTNNESVNETRNTS